MEKLERIVKFSKAFDKRDTDPKKNYGIGGVKCWMILKGEKGATQFMFNTSIYLPHVMDELRDKPRSFEPEGWDVGYHSYKPIYEDHMPTNNCKVLDGKDCYYDGSSLRGSEWFKEFVSEGDEHIWKKLEEEYNYRFNEEGGI